MTGNFDARLTAAQRHLESGDLARAEQLIAALAAARPDHAPLHQLRGAVFFRQGRMAEAESSFRKATALDPGDAQAHNNLGQALRARDRTAAAADAFRRAAELDPDFADPVGHLGALARADGRPGDAVTHYRAALARAPDHAETLFNLGLALEETGAVDDALAAYGDALAARPGYVRAQNNLAALLDELGRHDEAEILLGEALSAAPESPELLNTLAGNLRARGRLTEAADALERAVTLSPDFSQAIWNLAFIQLAQGRFAEGWAGYRHRPSAERASFPFPEEPLAGDLSHQRFFIGAEQGLGDELFFLRFAPGLKARGATLIHRPAPPLASLAARLDCLDEVAEAGRDPRPDETPVSVAELPYLLAATDCPPSLAIAPDAERTEAMIRRLAEAGPPPYLGLTWRAGRTEPGSLYKEAPLAELAKILGGLGVTVIVLQRAPAPGELACLETHLGRPAADFSEANDDLEAMLALLSRLDDYVGVSNTNMHLRRAAGRAARVLVTHPAEYRWMAEGDTSPWFPGFRLYRERAGAGWKPALTRLEEDLGARHG